ncbi:methyltransferase, TIGR04325 family [uncultured Nitratireductor sp.]|uniref:methyltransferase, TIGR04325 family n=1 Tax=uncultured Nitratireductor sp. TaxID=520953 RepID=UPI0025EA22EC|nr:methyltransferase, TIGR04325 family [uncultured Nitratireductor sp.]
MKTLLHFDARKIKRFVRPFNAALSKFHLVARRAELTGAYPDRESAVCAAPRWALTDYDHDDVVPVALDKMSRVIDWDYPVLFWLERELRARSGKRVRLLDAGGHVGTKYRAFRSLLDFSDLQWQVYELPSMVKAGRKMAHAEGIGPELSFCDSFPEIRKAEILLCSGLLQYLDIPFTEFVSRLPERPQVILLNKVALREGPSIYTLQRGGPTFLPYHIRNKHGFLAELDALGYRIVDTWCIQYLAHWVASHPELGCSESRGYMLQRKDLAVAERGPVEPVIAKAG